MGNFEKFQKLHNVISIFRIPTSYNQFDFSTKKGNLPLSIPLPHPPLKEKELRRKWQMIEGLNHATITWTFAKILEISTLVSYKDGMLLDVPQDNLANL